MVEYEIIRTNGDDYDCDILIEGDIPEGAKIELSNCDIEARYVEPMVGGFERGQSVKLRLFDGKYERGDRRRSTKIASKGGNSYGSMSFRFNTMDWDVELIHLLVDKTERGKGLGVLLYKIFIGLCVLEDVSTIRMNIGGGEETMDWLNGMGIPKEDMEKKGKNLARVKTRMDRIKHDWGNLKVTKING